MGTAIARDDLRPGRGYIDEPVLARWAFGSPTASPLWLILRLWLGYEWLHAGYEKVHGAAHAAWSSGAAVHGFVSGAVAASKAPDHPQVAYGWWVSFLHQIDRHAATVGRTVAWTEVAIGILLIVGLFTGIAAFVGLLLNFSYVFSGSAGVNPAFMVVGILLVLAWRNAGWIGLDRWVLPVLGTPWHQGRGIRRHRAEVVRVPAHEADGADEAAATDPSADHRPLRRRRFRTRETTA